MHIDTFVGVDVKTKAHFRIIASQGFLNFSIYTAKLLLLCVVLFFYTPSQVNLKMLESDEWMGSHVLPDD